MAIYVSNHASANNANGGTNATTDAKADFAGSGGARELYNPADPAKRDVIFAAATIGGSVSFSGAGGFRFNNINQNLWSFGSNESQRMTFQGRSGDAVKFLASSGYWFQFNTVIRYFTMSNFEIDAVSMTSGDAPIKTVSQGSGDPDTNYAQFIFDNLIIRNAYTDGIKLSAKSNNWQCLNTQFIDFGRVGSNNQGIYGMGWNGLIKGCTSYKTGGNIQSTGLRLYTNSGEINLGYSESHDNVFENNLVYDCQSGIAMAGSNVVLRNNYLLRFTAHAINHLPQSSGVNSGTFILNNSLYGTGGNGYFNFSGAGAVYANLQLQNNIIYGFTTPINLNGITASVNANNLTTDPGYANQAANDLSITSGSSAYNAGATRAEVTVDKFGTSRPQGASYDIGAFEVVVGTPPVSIGRLGGVPNYFFQ